MMNALGLLKERRFLPLFVTQFLGAFNDNLFKTAMVLFATYHIYQDPSAETGFNAVATACGIIPFFLLSALSGQLADTNDKAKIIRIVKTAEIAIMLLGAAGIYIAWQGELGKVAWMETTGMAMMLGAVLCLGVHSTFFGPIKYAILPQHLRPDEVLGGTGLVEAATYIAILAGTVVAGVLAIQHAAIAVLLVALIGWVTARYVPPAPREGPELKINWNPITASINLIYGTMHIRRLFLAICAISFFWTMGAVLIVIFPPLAKNALHADKHVSTIMIALFSVGVAIGSVAINALLKGHTSAKYGPFSVLTMGVCLVGFSFVVRGWPASPDGQLYTWITFFQEPRAWLVVAALSAIAVFGGMFVVPLYAFLTTTVSKDQTARTVAANNVVNAGSMFLGACLVVGLQAVPVSPENLLFVVAAMSPIAALLAYKLHQACD